MLSAIPSDSKKFLKMTLPNTIGLSDKRKESETALIGPHSDTCNLDSNDRRRLFNLEKAY